MTEKIAGTIAIGAIGTALTLARRYKNSRSDAGYGIAGWTMFLILIL